MGASTFYSTVYLSLSNSAGETNAYTLNSSNSPTAENNDSGGMYFDSLTYTRVGGSGAGNSLQLSLVDNTQSGLESKLANNFRNLTLKYVGIRQNEGGTSSTVQHGPYRLLVTDWQTTMMPYGCKINLTAVSCGISALNSSLPLTKDGEGYEDITLEGPPHKAVKALLDRCNVSYRINGQDLIEDCQPVSVSDKESANASDSSGGTTEKTYVYSHGCGSVFDFIMKKIAPHAVSSGNGKRDFMLYFIDKQDTDGLPIVAFMPKDGFFDKISKTHSVSFEFNSENSFVSSWSPSYSGKQLLGVCGIQCVYYDVKEKKNVTLTAEGSVAPSEGQKYLQVVSNKGSKGEIQGVIDNMFKQRMYGAHRARMNLVNFSDVSVGDKVTVKVVTKDGHMHHTSGTWYVSGVTDNISSGMISTGLELKLLQPLDETETELQSKFPHTY